MLVIAKAYGDRPLTRRIAQDSGEIVYLVDPAINEEVVKRDEMGVGFPRWAVFSYDAELADSLSQAWVNGDSEHLSALWARVTRLS